MKSINTCTFTDTSRQTSIIQTHIKYTLWYLKPLTSFILRSSFTTSVGFMSFCWKTLLTLCQSFPSLQTQTALKPLHTWIRQITDTFIYEEIKSVLTEWAVRTPRLSDLCMLSRVWSPVSAGTCPPSCKATPAGKVSRCSPNQKRPASTGKSSHIAYDNQPEIYF